MCLRHLRRCLVALFILALFPLLAFAQPSRQILQERSPSIVIVAVFNPGGQTIGQGSGVVVAAKQVITNCHVVANASSLQVRQSEKTFMATVQYADPDRDLCQLSVPALSAPPALFGVSNKLVVGQRVYAIGAPQGREFTLSEGTISGLRQHEGSQYIQTSAVIFPGSSGGGLFDEDGRLVGITAFYLVEGKKLNYALPADWIAQLPSRSRATSVNSGTSSGLAWLNRALVLEQKRDWEELLKLAQQWVKSEPGNAGFFLGKAYGGLKQYEQAVLAYRETVRLQPDDADAWFNLGVGYGVLRQYDDALQAYREAQRLHPDKVDTLFNLGNTYNTLKQYDLAIQTYQEALRYQPGFVDAWVNLGVNYNRMHQYEEAVKAYQEALRLQPGSTDALYNLGVTYYRQGKHDKVQEIFGTLRNLDPNIAGKYSQLLLSPADR